MSGSAEAVFAPVVEVQDLVVHYGNQRVLDGVSLSVQQGEIMVIMGGSGSGKSTLLRYLLGLQRPDGGTIRIFGKDIAGLDAGDLTEIVFELGLGDNVVGVDVTTTTKL